MKSKILVGTMIVGALALWCLRAVNVAAQAPVNDSPFTAVYTFGEVRQIEAGSALWFKFDYTGDRSPILIALPDGTITGLEFRVYTPDQVARLSLEDKYVGQGTAAVIPCESARCPSSTLTWMGAFPGGGTYYVKVSNPNNRWVTFQLFISGAGVSLGPSVAAAPEPSPTPTTAQAGITTSGLPQAADTPIPTPLVEMATSTPAPENDSPYTAKYIQDNRDQTLAPNSVLWYKFDYGGDRSSILIVLPYGNSIGVEFRVYTPEQAMRLADGSFVGRGSTSKIACDVGICNSDDLSWLGSFTAPGTYYVQVVNDTSKERTFRLLIRGTNVNIEGYGPPP